MAEKVVADQSKEIKQLDTWLGRHPAQHQVKASEASLSSWPYIRLVGQASCPGERRG